MIQYVACPMTGRKPRVTDELWAIVAPLLSAGGHRRVIRCYAPADAVGTNGSTLVGAASSYLLIV